jgi:spermidine/putrescine transport system permease protein
VEGNTKLAGRVAKVARPSRQGFGDRLYGAFLRSESLRGYALLSPVILIMLALLAAPLVMLGLYSLWTQVSPLEIDTALTLDRYRDVLTRETFQQLFLRTITISGIVTAVTVLTAYPIAYYVAFHVTRNKFIWLVLLTIPFWTSFLLRVFAWRIILGYEGVINGSLIQLGLIPETAPLDLLYNQTAVIITLAHAYAVFAVLPIYVSLEKIDRSILEAAADLGDGPLRRFLRITLPLSLPGVIAAAVVIFVPTTGDYVTPKLVGDANSTMLSNIVQVYFKQAPNWPLGAALAISSMAFVALIVIFFASAVQLAGRSVR